MGGSTPDHKTAAPQPGPFAKSLATAGVKSLATAAAQAVSRPLATDVHDRSSGHAVAAKAALAAGAGGAAGGAMYGHNPAVVSLFGGMYGAAADSAIKKPWPLPPPPHHPSGLDSYKVVPDNFIGPLAPGQLRQSQFNELKAYNFDGFNVKGNDFTGPLDHTQMKQADFDQLVTSWLNIDQGRGMEITGSTKDQAAFKQMLRSGMTDSPIFRQTIAGIGNDTDPKHKITAAVGRSQPEVLGDSFGTNAIDLDDLDAWPAAAPQDHKNQFTRNEDILHFLTERQYAQSHPDPGGNQSRIFPTAHQHGIDTQNLYRDERGQSHVLTQTGNVDASGSITDATVKFADGSNEKWLMDHGRIAGITPP